jgi:rhodanese-related sulfurtransferase
MTRFIEYTSSHPFLVAAAVILLVLAIVIEFRERAKGSSLIGASDAVRLMNSGALVLDVRDSKDYEAGHIIDARSVPAGELAARAETLKKYKEKPVVVCCESGFASASAAKTLQAQGFNKVVTLRGGLRSWRQDNLPLTKGAAKKEGKQA